MADDSAQKPTDKVNEILVGVPTGTLSNKHELIDLLLQALSHETTPGQPRSTDQLTVALQGIGVLQGVLSETKLKGVYRMATAVDMQPPGSPLKERKLVEFFFSASDVHWVSRYRDDLTAAAQKQSRIVSPGNFRT